MTIEKIRTDYREMCFAVKQRIRIDNALGAYVRTRLGWSKDLPEDEAKKIRAAAALAIKNRDERFVHLVDATDKAREPFDEIERQVVKRMERAAKALPVWTSFAEGVRGFGAKGLAVIVGEAGDLSDYETLPRLYKRLGLAPYAGKSYCEWRKAPGGKGLSSDEWVDAGYSPRRRAAMFAYVGEPLIKQGPYAEVYQMRREIENQRTDNKMAQHRRAHRYVEKYLVKHLWQAWNGIPVVPEFISRAS